MSGPGACEHGDMRTVPEVSELVEAGRRAGLEAVGVATAAPFDEVRVTLERRRAAGLAADMQFTYRNPARSTDPARSLPGARSLVVGATSFAVSHTPRPARPAGRVAAYATDDHYAHLRTALGSVAEILRREGWRAVVLADQNALVDRAAAHRAGIGWWGRSTNILVPGAGSTVVLGSVVTDAPLVDTDPEPVADACGSCRRCLDACPTGALVAPGVLDARRCLAWIVQAPGMIDPVWREALGDRLYGCDDCQDACPPNRVPRARPGPAAVGEPDGRRWVDVVELLSCDDETLLERFGRWYIAGRDPAHLRRNALVVCANTADPAPRTSPEVVAVLERHLGDPRPVVRAHAVWAARRLGLDELCADAADDPDERVRAEHGAPVVARGTSGDPDPDPDADPFPPTGRRDRRAH